MSNRDWNGIFEAIGTVYLQRFGRLRPGKDDPFSDSSGDENRKQFKEWYQSDQSREDFVDRMAVLEAEIQRCECEELTAEVERLNLAVEEWKDYAHRAMKVVEAAKERVNRGHSDTCGREVTDVPCNCGHNLLVDALTAMEVDNE
jgi:hypothetical protein